MYGQCNPKGNKCCTPGCFLPGLLSCSSVRAWVAETVEARARDVQLVSVRLNDPDDLDSNSVACSLAKAARQVRYGLEAQPLGYRNRAQE